MHRIIAAAAAFMAASPAVSAVVNINDAYHFVDRIGTNSFGNDGNRLALTFGVFEIDLNSTQGTTGTYEQNGVTGDLFDVSNNLNNQFAARVDYDPNLTGSWELTFENDGDITVFNTPEVGTADAPQFVTNVSQSGLATTPTFTFTPPDGVDRVQIQILDLQQSRVSSDLPQLIFQENLDNGETSFTIPDGELDPGGVYSIAFQADVYRPGQEFSLLGRSRVFYDFVAGALPDTGGVPVYLPTTDTTSGTPIFNFDNAVVKDTLAYYDPILAIGYDFALGAGDPFFRSVELPDIGDGLFDLFLPDGSGGFSFIAQLTAGVEYLFSDLAPSMDIDMFRILGIELSAGIDPLDSTAFVTGLSFMENGQFTGSMTPITQEVSPVPLPAAGWLLLGGVVGLGALRRRKARAA